MGQPTEGKGVLGPASEFLAPEAMKETVQKGRVFGHVGLVLRTSGVFLFCLIKRPFRVYLLLFGVF